MTDTDLAGISAKHMNALAKAIPGNLEEKLLALSARLEKPIRAESYHDLIGRLVEASGGREQGIRILLAVARERARLDDGGRLAQVLEDRSGNPTRMGRLYRQLFPEHIRAVPSSTASSPQLQRTTGICPSCGELLVDTACLRCRRLARADDDVDPAPARILVELAVSASGNIVVDAVRSRRMRFVEDDISLRATLAKVCTSSAAASFDWATLADEVTNATFNHVSKQLDVSDVFLRVGVRVVLQRADLRPPETSPSSVEFVAFDDALLRNAAEQHPVNFSRVEAYRAHAGGSVVVATSPPLRTTKVSVFREQNGSRLYFASRESFDTIDGGTVVEIPPLPARAELDVVTAKEPIPLRARITILGDDRDHVTEPFFAATNTTMAAEAYLDVGSTNTKLMLRFVKVNSSLQPLRLEVETALAPERIGVPSFDKASFVDNPAAYRRWLASALRGLSGFVRAHRAVLQSLDVAFPNGGGVQRDDPSLETVANACLVDGLSGLRVMAEHEALAHRYLAAVSALVKIAREDKERVDERENEIEHAKERRDRAQREWATYKKTTKGFFGTIRKLWHKEPSTDPDDIKIPREVRALGEWFRALRKAKDRSEIVLLLDAGGFSLDASILRGGKLVDEMSKSYSEVGGEEVSRRLHHYGGGEPKSRAESARAKAKLGTHADPRNPDVQRYRVATEAVYLDAVGDLVEKMSRDLEERRVLVISSGGASRNPFFESLVESALKARDFKPFMVTASIISRNALEAEEHGYHDDALRRFADTEAADSGTRTETRSGSFDIVAGLAEARE